MADEFLFPMTSRASYSSSYPDSDGEFCEPETPVVSRQPSVIMDPSKLERYSSDPNLHDKKSINGVIPDYNAPPPNSAMNVNQQPPKVVTTTRSNRQASYTTLPLHSQTDSVDELPLPPTPLNAVENPYRYESIPEPSSVSSSRRKSRTSATSISSSASKRSQSQPPKSLPPMMPNGSPPSPPVQPPPSVERHKKPSRLPRDGGYHTYSSRRHHNGNAGLAEAQGSLDRRTHLRDLRMTVYDAYGNGQQVSTPPTATGTNGIYATTSRYRSQDYHSLMSMSSGHAKPVPPPKPKSYPYHRTNGTQQHLASTSFVGEGTYMNSLPPSTNGHGTYSNARQLNDDDSGQGSSLDRDYAIYNNDHHHHHRYANPPVSSNYANGNSPSMVKHPQYGLDLTNNREYRSSAFELYKKPANGGHDTYQNSVW